MLWGVTPVVTEHLTPRAWVVTLLVVAGVCQLFPAGLFSEPGILHQLISATDRFADGALR